MSQWERFVDDLVSIGLSSKDACDLLIKDSYLQHLAHHRNVKHWNQFGGSSYRIINYKGKDFKFYKKADHDRIIYSLHSQSNKNKNCIVIFVDKKLKNAYLHEISNNMGCISEYQIEEGGGRILLKLAKQLVKSIKEEYKLTFLFLTDNASKGLKDKNDKNYNVILSHLLFLTQGITYYEKDGFKPVSQNSQEKVSYDENIIKMYNKTKKKYAKLKVKDIKINFKSLLKKVGKENTQLVNNIMNTFSNKRVMNLYFNNIISYYSHNKKYIPIIRDLIDLVFIDNEIILPKLWGMKL